MPHIILEHSSNLPALPDFRALFGDIHRILNSEGGIKLENCKSRAREAEHYHIGDGNPDNAFIHLAIDFVEGREPEIKQAIGHECLALLKQYYESHLSDSLQITIAITDIPLVSYFKYPEGTLTRQ